MSKINIECRIWSDEDGRYEPRPQFISLDSVPRNSERVILQSLSYDVCDVRYEQDKPTVLILRRSH